MAHSDSELIKRTLDGDETAFGFLVDKYKGAVHALAYRKIGDFHTAEEITQDTFLQAYQKLSTLKDWRRFPGWLYTIASRFCLMWHRKNRLPMQSIDAVETHHVDALAQARYADARTRETVYDALEELPESQRTVLTLHYLGGMKCEEIARFMGTSRGAILDRLYRARLQLKKELIPMMRQTLGAFQLPPTFTTRIMNRIDQFRPTSTPVSKPLTPWLAAMAALVVALYIGLGQQLTTRSQRPYSLDAPDSTVQVELIDAPAIYRPETKLALANRSGQSNSKNGKPRAQPDGAVLGAASTVSSEKGLNDSEWVQTNGPYGGEVIILFRASDGTLYAVTDSPGVFRSDTNGDSWLTVNDGTEVYSDGHLFHAWTVTEADGVVYLSDDLGFLHSKTRGESWRWVKFPDRLPTSIAFAVSEGRIYISQNGDGVVYSDDYGKSWAPIRKGLPAKPPEKLVTFGTTLFAKCGDNLFRIKLGEASWTKVTNLQNLRFIVAAQGALFIGSGTDLHRSTDGGDTWMPMTDKVSALSETDETVREYRCLTTVEGNTFILANQLDFSSYKRLSYERMPLDHAKSRMPTGFVLRVRSIIEGVTAFGDTVLLLLSNGELLRSSEDGMWSTTETDLKIRDVNSMVALSEHAVCVATSEGVFRLTCGEKSLKRINKGLISTNVYDLVSYENALYATTGDAIVKSVDGGNRWTPIHQGLPVTKAWTFATVDSELYLGLHETNMGTRKPSTAGIYRLAPDGISWIPVQTEMRTDDIDQPKQELYRKYERLYSVDELVISGNIFYAIAQMGNGHGLYQWQEGERFWTRISPDVERRPDSFWSGLAVLGKTVYFDATENLMRSNNQGKTWSRIDTFPGNDETLGRIEGPIIVGNAVYISVYELGVFRSTNRGKTWEAVTAGLPQGYTWRLHAVGNTLFTIEREKGIFQLGDDRNTWAFVKPYPPFYVNAITILDTTLYAATGGQGVYRIGLGKPEGK